MESSTHQLVFPARDVPMMECKERRDGLDESEAVNLAANFAKKKTVSQNLQKCDDLPSKPNNLL